MSNWYESHDPRLFRAVDCNNCNNITVWVESETCHLCNKNINSKSCTTCESKNIVYLPHDLFQYIACLDCGVRDESGLEVSDLEMNNFNFFKCNLQGSSWSGCWVDNGNFRSANLSRATVDSWFTDCDFSGASLLDLKQENAVEPSFINCNFTGASLAGSNLSSCSFTGSTFSQTDLSNVCFDYANLSNIDLSETNLEGATFQGAILEGAIFPTEHIPRNEGNNGDKYKMEETEDQPALREDYMRDDRI